MLKAVIFDLDGVIADSHPIHEAAWKTLFTEQGLDPQKMNLDYLSEGQPRRETFRHFFGALPEEKIEELSRRKDELYTSMTHKLAPKPGLMRVLDELEAAGIAIAVGSSGQRRRIMETLERLRIAARFSAIVSGDDVGAVKPSPQIFLRAASLLRVSPQEIAVIEDSPDGIKAAHAAAMKCVGYAPPDGIAALQQAGADDAIVELPQNAVAYFARLLEHAEGD
jgi:beta-phosphoglucomutase